LSNNDVLQILAQHQQKWEAMATKLLYSNSALKAIDIVQDMYLKVFDELTNNELEINNLIVNNEPHYGVIKKIIKRLIQVKSKDKNNNIRLKDLHKEIADKEKQEENIDDKIDKVLQEMYWFDRKLFNLYRKEFHKGLGDTIAKVTKATGIDKAVKFIAGDDCGCEERKEALNKLFPYHRPECLKESEYNYLKEFYKTHKDRLTKEEQVKLIEISNRVLHTKRQLSSCSSCVRDLIADCKRLFNNYNG